MIPSVIAVLGVAIGPTSFFALVWGAILVVVLVFIFIVRALILDAKRT
jgi:hypothetical protein